MIEKAEKKKKKKYAVRNVPHETYPTIGVIPAI